MGKGKRYDQEYKDMIVDLYKTGMRLADLNRKNMFFHIPTSITEILFFGLLYYFLGRDLSLGLITIGSFTMLYNAAYFIKVEIATIQCDISYLRQSSLESQNYFDLIERTSINNSVGKIKFNNKDRFDIEFKNVYFKYPNCEDYKIKNVSFKINSKEIVTFVDENGAGKTTILKLLLGLYTPEKGEILINSISLKEYNKESLYNNMGVVFQDFNLYAFSILDNILLSNISCCNKDKLIESLKKAGLYEKVKSLPKKENTAITCELEDDGVFFRWSKTKACRCTSIHEE